MGEMAYWFCDYVGLENSGEERRHILGIRYWSKEKTKKQTIFLKRKIPIPTRFIYRGDKEQLQEVMTQRENDPELSRLEMTCFLSKRDKDHIPALERKHPLTEFLIRDDSFDVFQLRVPAAPKILDKLPATRIGKKKKKKKEKNETFEPRPPKGPWQKNGYEWQVRMELYPKWLQRKFQFNGLEEVIRLKEKVEKKQSELEEDVKWFVEGNDENSTVRSNRTRTLNNLYNYLNNEKTRGPSNYFAFVAKKILEPVRLKAHRVPDLKKFTDLMINEYESDKKKRKKLQTNLFNYLEGGPEKGLKKFFEDRGRCAVNAITTEMRANLVQMRNQLAILDPENELIFNPDSREYEVVLNCYDQDIGGFKLRDQINGIEWRSRLPTEEEIEWGADPDRIIPDWLSPEEISSQVFCFLDIEKTFYKTDEEQDLLDRRQKLIDEWMAAQKLKTDRARDARQAELYRKKQEIEEKLTILIDDKPVKLWNPEYIDKITDFNAMYRMQDGKIIKEYHTIRQFHDKERQELIATKGREGYKVFFHGTRKQQMDAVAMDMKKRNVFSILAHNLAYDIPHTIKEAKEVKSEKFELFVSNILPRIDVSKSPVYKRLKRLVEFFDTYRLTVSMLPFFKSRDEDDEEGSHKLAYVAKKHGYDLEKSHDAKELRADAVRHLRGDDDAADRLLTYGIRDVPPLEAILTNGEYVRLLCKLRFQILPFCSLTEIGFAPNIVGRIFDAEHWEQNNNKLSEQRGRLQLQQRKKDFEKIYAGLKHGLMSKAGIDIKGKSFNVTYDNVWQCYMPQEQWIQDVFSEKFGQWKKFFNSLEHETPISRYKLLRYARMFLKPILMEHHFYTSEAQNFTNNKARLNLKPSEIDDMLQFYWETMEAINPKRYGQNFFAHKWRSTTENYNREFGILIDAYVMCNLNFSKFLPRVTREKPQLNQTVMQEVVNYFKMNSPRIACVHDHKEIIEKGIDLDKSLSDAEKERSMDILTRFTNSYNRLSNLSKDLAAMIKEARNCWASEYEKQPPNHFTIDARNVVYVAQQYRRLAKLERRFFARFGLPPEEFSAKIRLQKTERELKEAEQYEFIDPDEKDRYKPSFSKRLTDTYAALAAELKNYIIIDVKGDYVYLAEKSKKESMLIPIRQIKKYTKRKPGAVNDPEEQILFNFEEEDSD